MNEKELKNDRLGNRSAVRSIKHASVIAMADGQNVGVRSENQSANQTWGSFNERKTKRVYS